MKTILLLIFLFSLNICYAQSDTVALNTAKIFTITCLNPDKSDLAFSQYSTYNEVYLDTLTKNFLTFERKYLDLNNPTVSTKTEKVALKDIQSIGYANGTKETFGLFLGMGVGALAGGILGAVAQRQDNMYSGQAPKSVAIGIIAGIVSGGALGYLFGGTYNNYEETNLERFATTETKYAEILRIATKGINYSKRKNK